MPSIRELVDANGWPPRELLRDWAWQIASAQQSQDADLLPAITSSAAASDWWSVEVAGNGVLQLHGWSSQELDTALDELRGFHENEACEPSDSPLSEWSSPNAPTQSTARVRLGRKSKQPTKIKVVIAVATTLVALLFVGVALVSSKSKQTIHAELRVPPSQTSELATVQPDAASGQSNDRMQSSDTLEASGPIELQTPAAIQPAIPAGIDGVLGNHSSGLTGDLPLDPTLSNPLEDTQQGESLQLATQPAPESIDQVDETPVDAMQQVARALEAAQVSDVESTKAGESDITKSVVLSRDEFRRTYSLPRSATARTKASSLTAALECPEGFTCKPSEPQTLEPKTPCTWQLYDQAHSGPRVCLIVQALSRWKRHGEIEFLFYGSSEDMPQLSLPLNRRWLDPLLRNLQGSQLRWQWMSDTLSKSSVSSENRSQMSQQKKLAAEQLKLCKRLIEVVAQCDRLADLIDG